MVKKRLKRLLALVCAVLLLMPAYVWAAGDKTTELYIENSNVSEKQLKVYINSNVNKDKTKLSADNFQLILGDKTLDCTDAAYFSDSGEAAYYLFLVDVSGSIGSQKLEEMKEYLKLVAAQLGENDYVCINTLGNELSVGKFVKGKKEIEAQIDKIKGLPDDTNLYYGIAQSLKILDSDEKITGKRALLVLSDGEDEQTTGITRDEVNELLKETNIPVYTAAFLDGNADTAHQEFAKILGSFARLSSGGIHTAFGVEDISMKKSAERMAASIGDSLILTADLSGYETGAGQAYLQVTLQIDDKAKAEDSLLISEQDMIAAGLSEKETEETETEKETETQTAAPESETAQEDNKEDGKSFPVIMIAAGTAAIVLVIIIAVVLSRKKRRRIEEEKRRAEEQARREREQAEKEEQERLERERREQEEQEAADNAVTAVPEAAEEASESDEAPEKDSDEEKDRDEEKESDGEKDRDKEDGEISEAYDGQPENEEKPDKVQPQTDEQAQVGEQDYAREMPGENIQEPEAVIYLTKIGISEEKTYEIRIGREVTLGRTPGRANYAFPEDGHMSGVHCALTYFDNRIIIWDKGSMNGTQVNGVPITAPYPLNCDDIIHIGNTEFRVHW